MKGWLKNSNNLPYKIVLFLVFWFFKIVYRHRIYGAKHFYSGAAILAGNHTSFYDPPILAISTPHEVHFLARKTLFDFPLFGRLIRKLNAHPISGKPQDIGVFKTVLSLMKHGKKLIMFPEGKRSKTGKLEPLKPGISVLIGRSKAAVIPVYIHGAFEIWPSSRKFPRFFGKTACVFGSPLHFQEGDLVQERIEIAIGNLKEWFESGAKGPIP